MRLAVCSVQAAADSEAMHCQEEIGPQWKAGANGDGEKVLAVSA